MPRGGSREKAGRRSTWKSGCKFEDTKSIRVPINIADQLLEIAHKLDAGEPIVSKEVEKEFESDIAMSEQPQQLPFLLMEGDSTLIPIYVPTSIVERVKRYISDQQEKWSVECPACESSDLRLDGHTAKGKQRYRCKTCGKKFTPPS